MELNQWLKSFQLKDNRLVGPFFMAHLLLLDLKSGLQTKQKNYQEQSILKEPMHVQ